MSPPVAVAQRPSRYRMVVTRVRGSGEVRPREGPGDAALDVLRRARRPGQRGFGPLVWTRRRPARPGRRLSRTAAAHATSSCVDQGAARRGCADLLPGLTPRPHRGCRPGASAAPSSGTQLADSPPDCPVGQRLGPELRAPPADPAPGAVEDVDLRPAADLPVVPRPAVPSVVSGRRPCRTSPPWQPGATPYSATRLGRRRRGPGRPAGAGRRRRRHDLVEGNAPAGHRSRWPARNQGRVRRGCCALGRRADDGPSGGQRALRGLRCATSVTARRLAVHGRRRRLGCGTSSPTYRTAVSLGRADSWTTGRAQDAERAVRLGAGHRARPGSVARRDGHAGTT